MTEKSKLTRKTTELIENIVEIVEKFNKNSMADNLGFIIVPTPFHNFENNNRLYKNYVQYLNELQPNLELSKITDGTYLSAFLLLNNVNDHDYRIWISKIQSVLTKALNNNKINMELYPEKSELHESTITLFEKFGIIKYGIISA